jgi:hypothetical protein
MISQSADLFTSYMFPSCCFDTFRSFTSGLVGRKLLGYPLRHADDAGMVVSRTIPEKPVQVPGSQFERFREDPQRPYEHSGFDDSQPCPSHGHLALEVAGNSPEVTVQ